MFVKGCLKTCTLKTNNKISETKIPKKKQMEYF